MAKAQQKVRIEWTLNFAYAIGLIASDGNLNPDERHISLRSIDRELIEHLKTALNLKNKIGQYNDTRGNRHKCYYIYFGDIVFYNFLNSIGLHQAKSRTIQSVIVPDQFFADFLRGLFDGDGTIYSFWDTRWPKSFGYQVSFASASLAFIDWLKEELSTQYELKGFIRKGKGVYNLRYVKGDSRRLYSIMYNGDNLLYLDRKYHKISDILARDAELKSERTKSQKEIVPR